MFKFGLVMVCATLLGCNAALTGVSNKEIKIMTFNEGNFQSEVIESDKPVMVDFWATWCPPCNHMTPVVEKMAEETDGRFVIGKVNVEEETELAKKYNINAIPAFLFFKNGEPKKSVVGAQTKETLMEILESLEDKDNG